MEERASVFPKREALALALAHSPGLYDLETLEGAFAELERDKHLLPAIRRGVGESWTTARAVNAEREVIERTRAGIGGAEPLIASPITDNALEGLTEGQREAARLILEGRDRTVEVQGYAGRGKTVMLRRVAALAADRRVIGLAPSASSVRTLARETGLGCRTLQWFLARCREVADGVADAETLDALKRQYAGALLVVDEMSLAGTAQARALLRIADRLGVARLVLVGDSRQLRGVEAGQLFGQLQRAGMATAVMDEVRRQRDPDLKAAVLDMIEGAPAEALDRLGGNLHEVPAEALGETAATLWLRLSPEARAETALLAPTRALRADINDAVREGLEAEGTLHGRAIELATLVPLGLTRTQQGDARHWREGDVALFHRELRHYRIRAGDACAVTEVGEDRIGLAHPDGRARHLVPSGDIRYRLGLYEPRTLPIGEGERLRWTRNDAPRGLINGEEAEVRAIGASTLKLSVAGGRDIAFARNDPQLRHLAHPHGTAHSSHAGLAHTRAGLGHEGAENGRGEFGEALHADANQKGFEDSKVVTVVAYRCLAQTSFLTQVREEARCLGQERIACDSCPTPSHKRRDQKGDELFDRAPRALPTTTSAISAATGFSPFGPVGNKGLDVLGELFEGPGATTPGELRELPQNRYPWPDIARRIALARQRRDVAFDGLGEPTATDLVDGIGLEEIVFQHDNLLSSGWERRSSRIEGHSLCAPGRALLLQKPHVGRPRPHHPVRHITTMMFRGTSS